ncbi:hypothetical protein Vretifemale_1800 [Volvox reticuliferus]|uniref:Uncharacterized protein n=1 Tax=Volvox reticuliferus TaxID=1737510 RepID=A0A8J4BYK3_9CHLO|nr:hypothetical protein Vretifemale_1800 [Volvox reticuliferus]
MTCCWLQNAAASVAPTRDGLQLAEWLQWLGRGAAVFYVVLRRGCCPSHKAALSETDWTFGREEPGAGEIFVVKFRGAGCSSALVGGSRTNLAIGTAGAGLGREAGCCSNCGNGLQRAVFGDPEIATG